MQGFINSLLGSSSTLVAQARSLLVGAVLLILALIAGWLLGLLARAIFMVAFSHRVEEVSRRLGYKQLEQSLRLHVSLASLVGWAVRVIVSGLALLLLVNTYFPDSAQALLVQGVGFLPNLLIALTIIFVGLFLSQFLADLAFTTARTAKRTDAQMLSTAVRVGVVLLATAAALLELGVATLFITTVLIALLGMTALALGLAAGLGGADYVRDLLAGRIIRTQLRPGQRVEIDGVTGIVVECGPSATLIATDDGKRALMPNKLIAQKSVVLG